MFGYAGAPWGKSISSERFCEQLAQIIYILIEFREEQMLQSGGGGAVTLRILKID